MAITSEMVKSLREKSGVGMMECKRALEEAQADTEKAFEILRKKGLAFAQKKAGRATQEGLISSYIHVGGKIGVLLHLGCETDFVARTDDFIELCHELCMHIAASNPLFVKREDVPAEIMEREKSIYRAQAETLKKPAAVLDKITEGKLDKFVEQICLMEQPFIRTPEINIQNLISQKVAKLGENITVQKFVRYKIGE